MQFLYLNVPGIAPGTVATGMALVVDRVDTGGFKLREIAPAPHRVVNLSTAIVDAEMFTEGLNGDIVIATVSQIASFNGGVEAVFYLKCNDADRRMILGCRGKRLIWLWHTGGCNEGWKYKPNGSTKSFDTLFIDDKRLVRLQDTLKRFVDNRPHYSRCGIPYKLSFLLDGPPGTGKTSVIKAIANSLRADTFVINTSVATDLGNIVLSLEQTMVDPGQLRVIALEDIHLAPKELHEQVGELLDGSYDVTNCVFVMTSNIPAGQLDPMLTRSGRVNYSMTLGHLSSAMTERMVVTIVPQLKPFLAQFMAAVGDTPLRPSMLEGYLMQYLNEPDPCIALSSLPILVANAKRVAEENKLDFSSGPSFAAI